MVATKSFGMGVNKPNIRTAIHFGFASSIEALYQEAEEQVEMVSPRLVFRSLIYLNSLEKLCVVTAAMFQN